MRPEDLKEECVTRQSVGIDVSKGTLVATLCKLYFDEEPHYTDVAKFGNDKTGFNQLVKWSRKMACKGTSIRYVMEATGVYHEELANHLAKIGCYAIVLMPNKARQFAMYEDIITKNDKVDSRVLSLLGCVDPFLRRWQPLSPLYRELRSMTRFSQNMQKMRTELSNLLEALLSSYDPEKRVVKHYESLISELDKRIEKNLADMRKKVNSNEELAKKVKAIETIPSVGFKTIVTVLAETNGFALIQNRKQLAGYAGLGVKESQSGNVEHKTKITKRGNSRIRAILYMPAIQCHRNSARMKAVYERIVERNPRTKMIAVTAMERRLLLLIYTIWKSGKAYDENYMRK